MPSTNIILGPLLGLEGEWESTTCYSVTFLSEKEVTAATLAYQIEDTEHKANFILVEDLSCGRFWRAEILLPFTDANQICDYRIIIDQQNAGYPSAESKPISSWSFFCPAANSPVQMAFASCNGFSSDKARAKHKAPVDHLWQRMLELQTQQMAKNSYQEVLEAPYAALLMGGDQVYADAIFNEGQPLYDWSKQPLSTQISFPVSRSLSEEIDAFYLKTYIQGWTEYTSMRNCLASIPTVMMWDDHDIIDGWGSQYDQLEACPTYKAMFESAKKYFALFQLRGFDNRSLQQTKSASMHFGMTLRFRDYAILVMDNRSQRTLHQIMGDGKQDFVESLDALQADWKPGQKLIIMSAVPFLYRHFSESDANIKLSIRFDAYDDIADHWRFSTHYGEMCSLLNKLLQFQAALAHTTPARIFIISGDVHVACSGVYRVKSGKGAIVQLISSGIVHPPPHNEEQSAIMLSSSTRLADIDLGGNIVISATLRKDSAGNTLLFNRNFACIHEGSDQKVWVNWHYETIDFPNLNHLPSRTPVPQTPRVDYKTMGLPY